MGRGRRSRTLYRFLGDSWGWDYGDRGRGFGFGGGFNVFCCSALFVRAGWICVNVMIVRHITLSTGSESYACVELSKIQYIQVACNVSSHARAEIHV